MNPRVTIVTPTVGTRFLGSAVQSVRRQTYPNVRHLVVVDGPEHEEKVRRALEQVRFFENDTAKLMVLPWNTGAGGWCGHEVYAAISHLLRPDSGELIAFLDEDNFFDQEHVAALVQCIQESDADYAHSLRRIVDADGAEICLDQCESLGLLGPTYMSDTDRLVDTSCYMLKSHVAHTTSVCWQRAWGADRVLIQTLMQQGFRGACSMLHSMNYRVGCARSDSVQADFFIHGNAVMKSRKDLKQA